MAQIYIPLPGAEYDRENERRRIEVIQNAFADTISLFDDINVARVNDPLERVMLGNRVVMTSPDGSRFALIVDNAGALATIAI